MPSLRGQLRPCEGAGQLPALLLDSGSATQPTTCRSAGTPRGFLGEAERVLAHGHESAH
jgi:hypothetical protein